MTDKKIPTGYPEPVPAATQLAVLPFTSAVAGYLLHRYSPSNLRVVMHRVMSRDGSRYIQQVSPYLGTEKYKPEQAGRIFPVTMGIVGNAMKTKSVVRTRHYDSHDSFLADLVKDMKKTNDDRRVEDVAKSYLAIPMISKSNSVLSILYADSHEFNIFSNDELIGDLVGMCNQFCFLMDELEERPLDRIKNYAMETGIPVEGDPTVYPTLQEVLSIHVPRYEKLALLNFEAGV